MILIEIIIGIFAHKLAIVEEKYSAVLVSVFALAKQIEIIFMCILLFCD